MIEYWFEKVMIILLSAIANSLRHSASRTEHMGFLKL